MSDSGSENNNNDGSANDDAENTGSHGSKSQEENAQSGDEKDDNENYEDDGLDGDENEELGSEIGSDLGDMDYKAYRSQYSGDEGVSFLDHKVNEAIQKRREERERAQAAGELAYMEKIVDEKLGEDFEDTPWVPPTIELAWEYRLEKLYRGGKAKLSKVKMTKATDVGLGLPMYFLFAKTFAIATFFMTILSVPALLFSYFGHRIQSEDEDAIGFYQLSIGNIGHDPESKDYEEESACTGHHNEDLKCVEVFTLEFTLVEVANILMVCEFLQILIFLLAINFLEKRHARMKARADGRTCSLSDYSVMVENIPPDTTVEQLVEHFSNLYPLDKPDWKNRPPLDQAEPVKHVSNTGVSCHKGTWVAEATVFKKIGSMIRAFKDKQKYMDDLLRCRARMKMYNTDTCHADGPNPRKFRKAEKDMIAAGTTIDQLTIQSLKQARKKMKITALTDKSTAQKKTRNSVYEQLEADALCGFVVFNYAESMARCLEDYSHYNSYPFKLFTPKKMIFRGRHITVTHSPEPDEIVWENLEISKRTKMYRRMLTAVYAFILLLIGFAFILQSGKYKAKFDEEVPKLDMCETEIPALFHQSYELPSGVELVRPDEGTDSTGRTRDDYDFECSSLVKGSFYAIYTIDGKFSQPLTNYSIIDVCQYGSSPATTDCPVAGQSIFCPCISTDSTDVCDTLSCSIPDDDRECTDFRASTIAGCYCYNQLLDLFSTGVFGLLSKLQSQDSSCEAFFTNYGIANVLTLAASLCTVVINVGLKFTMKKLAKGELHNTIDEEHSAIVVKVFLATYINMAVVALVAFGYVKNKPDIAESAQLFDGDFADFSPRWYAVVGSYLTLTFILQIFGPLGLKLLKYYVLSPCKMCYAHPKINNRTSHKYAMQADVNALELGGVFDTTLHNAQLLALLFFGMTYAPGLPLMMPLSMFAFTLYLNIDKMLLLRYYAKPPKMGDAVMRVVLKLLPWACVIRLCIACWMYSNYDVFPYTELDITVIPNFSALDTERVSELYNNWVEKQTERDILFFNTGDRITRGNVFPLFVLMVIIVVTTFIFNAMKHSPIYYFAKVIHWTWTHIQLNKASNGRTKKLSPFEIAKRGDPLRAEMAPFTGDYYQFLQSEFEKSKRVSRCLGFITKFVRPDLTEEELQQGWRVSYQGAYKVKMAQWMRTTRVAGVGRPKGSIQRTYELISLHGCYSYNLYKIPHYKTVMIAIQEGIESVAADMEMGLENDVDLESGRASSTSRHISVIGSYRNRQIGKQNSAVEKEKAKEKLWERPAKGKKTKVAPNNSDDENMYGIANGAVSSDDSDDSD
mmetsp:Transcript_15197/g.22859  ORF Transcript_15197/g.22859 Transcript_15197/m.22859 type:complete len:1310 (+) Transcript_15197:270-4199(+)|eukprot:CAMPEP_0185030508 /NCGR_PEP_ID=MMETSP1103-20130426/17512_1 /TAXON_ID=36769 /ORGANISM="Paraphysomonas bandaiensis, Strain Caron Lab Isolate" /LENGTH=1309 /DNA_ID=CAMNT_0027565681 /DNA_START=246 /DNA_END=4175 /DNA_ORIENTATION=+